MSDDEEPNKLTAIEILAHALFELEEELDDAYQAQDQIRSFEARNKIQNLLGDAIEAGEIPKEHQHPMLMAAYRIGDDVDVYLHRDDMTARLVMIRLAPKSVGADSAPTAAKPKKAIKKPKANANDRMLQDIDDDGRRGVELQSVGIAS